MREGKENSKLTPTFWFDGLKKSQQSREGKGSMGGSRSASEGIHSKGALGKGGEWNTSIKSRNLSKFH